MEKIISLGNLDHNRSNTQEREPFTSESFSKQLEKFELEPHQEIAAIGYFLIRQRAESVGITDMKDFDPSFVATSEQYDTDYSEKFSPHGELSQSEGIYDTEKNMLVPADGGRNASLTIQTHEMEHLLSDAQNIADSKMVNTEIYGKSGFHTIYTDDGTLTEKNKHTIRDTFRLFNEAITEIIAHDLCDDFTDETLGDLYKKIFPRSAAKNLAIHEEEIQGWITQINQNIVKATEEKSEAKVNFLTKSLETKKKELEKRRVLPILRGDPLKDKTLIAYPEMVIFVKKMMEGITLWSVKKGFLAPELSSEQSWANMQKAYLKGDLTHLDMLESIYGDGFLQKLSGLNYSNKIDAKPSGQSMVWKEYDELNSLVDAVNIQIQ